MAVFVLKLTRLAQWPHTFVADFERRFAHTEAHDRAAAYEPAYYVVSRWRESWRRQQPILVDGIQTKVIEVEPTKVFEEEPLCPTVTRSPTSATPTLPQDLKCVSPTPRREHIIFVIIPGNPGAPEFYVPFMLALRKSAQHMKRMKSVQMDLLCIGHAGHTKGHAKKLFNLDQQSTFLP